MNRFEYPDGAHCKDRRFRDLAKKCAKNDINAMWAMAEYFESLGDHSFYIRASNFWRYRAYLNDHPDARLWFEKLRSENPKGSIPSLMNASFSGTISGKTLYYGGFLFFDTDREYHISPVDQDGVVEVFSWCGDEGPDSDGFGREEYYDWWYLDKNLNTLPGVGWIHSYSRLDKRINAEKFQALHDAAAQAVRKDVKP